MYSGTQKVMILLLGGLVAGSLIGATGGSIFALANPGYYNFYFNPEGEPGFSAVGTAAIVGLLQGGLVGSLLGGAVALIRDFLSSDRKVLCMSAGGKALVAVAVLILGLVAFVKYSMRFDPAMIDVYVEGGELQINNRAHEDCVVTHVLSENVKAALPEPCFVRWKQDTCRYPLKSLQWKYLDGKSAPPPKSYENMAAVSFVARYSRN